MKKRIAVMLAVGAAGVGISLALSARYPDPTDAEFLMGTGILMVWIVALGISLVWGVGPYVEDR